VGSPQPAEVRSSQQGSRTTQRSALRLRTVAVNGKSLAIGSGEVVEAPSHPSTVAFVFGPDPLASNPPIRFQCQLDGWEDQWHERSLAMRLIVRFINSDQADIAENVFAVRGESPGWTGAFGDSTWIRRKEVIPVPRRRHSFLDRALVGRSAGAWVYAVRNLVAALSQSSTSLYPMIPGTEAEGGLAVRPRCTASGWGAAASGRATPGWFAQRLAMTCPGHCGRSSQRSRRLEHDQIAGPRNCAVRH
jgi:hypothetical protein